MHQFYERIEKVFKRAGTNRHRFCKKYGHNYQTLQSYWGSDRLPPGGFLEDVACEFHVSLDRLVLGRMTVRAGEDSPTLARLMVLLKQKSDAELLRIEGAVRMLEYLQTSDGAGAAHSRDASGSGLTEDTDWEDLEELPPADE